jgi:predicted transposase YdaD
MYRYDVLRETWIYQEIRQEIQVELQQQQVFERRQVVLEIIQARFPRLESLARKVVDYIDDGAMLHRLVVRVGTAKTEKEARQELLIHGIMNA